MTSFIDPGFEFCFELHVAVDPPHSLGGDREGEGPHFAPITGGTVDGPRLTGRVLTGGGDWWVGDGLTVRLDARYAIEAQLDEDTTAGIDVVNKGIWRTDPETFERMIDGEAVTEEDLYYRTAFTFRTDHPELRWLTQSQFIGYARPDGRDVVLRVFRLT